jgi:hypothetical protein
MENSEQVFDAKVEDAVPLVVDEETAKLIAEAEERLAALKAKAAASATWDPVGGRPVNPDLLASAAPASVVASPEPAPPPLPVVPAPAPVAATPIGTPVDCDPVAAKPGEIVQVITQLAPNSVLRGLKISDGFKVSAVMVGRQVFPAPGGGGSWEQCIGKVVPAQSFLILLVQNTTPNHLVARATWYVTGDGATVQQVQAPQAPPQAPVPPPVTAPLFHDGASQGFGLNTPAATQPIPVSRAVTPGTNEVCILIQRGECDRLLASLTGGTAISDHEKPSIVRQISSALKR